MKFRTTILLIIFSFTLLLLWDEWISYNTKADVPVGISEVDEINTVTPEENEDSSDLPTVNKLAAKKTAPVEGDSSSGDGW